MKRTRIACFCLLLVTGPVASAQLLSDFEVASENFYQRIKNIEFFMDRFNHETEGRIANVNKSDTVVYLAWLKERNALLFTLFDKQRIRKEGDAYVSHSDYSDLVRQVNDPYHQQYLHFADSNWYATLSVLVDYKGKSATVDCTLKINRSRDGVYTWVLSSVYSKDVSLDERFAMQLQFIPSVHGTDFMGVRLSLGDPSWIKNVREATNLKSRFADLLASKELRLQQINNITYHLLQLDNWIVVVSYTARQDANSGWLVSQLLRADTAVKQAYQHKFHLN